MSDSIFAYAHDVNGSNVRAGIRFPFNRERARASIDLPSFTYGKCASVRMRVVCLVTILFTFAFTASHRCVRITASTHKFRRQHGPTADNASRPHTRMCPSPGYVNIRRAQARALIFIQTRATQPRHHRTMHKTGPLLMGFCSAHAFAQQHGLRICVMARTRRFAAAHAGSEKDSGMQ